MIVIGILCTPLTANMIGIIVPYNEVYSLMQHHYVFVIPFGFAILEMKGYDIIQNVGNWIAYICIFLIAGTYVVSANSTYECLRISYNALNFQTQLILTDIYDLEGYRLNETSIIFAGFPNDRAARNNIKTYQYAIGLSSNVAYWNDWNGISTDRRNYLYNFCGIEAGMFSREEYDDIVQSNEFKEMPIWPEEGSVKMIQDMAVVKLSENPPL